MLSLQRALASAAGAAARRGRYGRSVPRLLLPSLFIVAVLCAGFGLDVVLTGGPFGTISYGWTAYSPLSSTAYLPAGLFREQVVPKIGLALFAIGAGSTGAIATALLLRRRPIS